MTTIAVSSREQKGWGLLVALILFALTVMLTTIRYAPPEPKPANAPLSEFSAGRAKALLYDLVGDGVPHPLGSASNARVRERILSEFRRLGYTPQVQRAFVCYEFGACPEVKNVLAQLGGRERRAAVVLAAHYDSVGAGPGACDDGVGVAAVLEIARALKSGPIPRHPIIFLIDDGEEPGFLAPKRLFRAPRGPAK